MPTTTLIVKSKNDSNMANDQITAGSKMMQRQMKLKKNSYRFKDDTITDKVKN
jgi:hypothetical protein